MSKVIDVHTHMYTAGWLDLLMRKGGPDLTVEVGLDSPWTVCYKGASFCVLEPPHFDFELRIKNMEKAGVDMAVVSMPPPGVLWGSSDESLEAAVMTNNEFAKAQIDFPEHIRWMAVLPWEHPELAVEELKRACDLGAVAAIVHGSINGRHLIDPFFAPVWQELDNRSLPVLVHPTFPIGTELMELDRYALIASTGFMIDTTLCISKMIFDGFFDRYPNLKIIASHAGATLPYLAGRFDRVFDTTARAKVKISKHPSEYLKHIYYDSVTYAQESLELCVHVGGEDHVLYGSDYPFNLGDMAGCLSRVNKLPEKTKHKIRSENAQRIFKL
ncbi:MAG: amidohydrolase family protein [Alphaproteobacteria bacterium]|nr:amidohydrolase family protein [Alphaproteobacteria bacterium]HPF45836.1 amidohydrolase family protein [Emcibacteraceae bacterium]HRW29337.1 amidohydrolase family protein [Emcibacteraceae bacterium]